MGSPTPPPAGLEPDVTSAQHQVGLTRWSVVVSAARSTPGSVRRQAREQICRAYWYPLYVYLRRQGQSAQAAEDLVQGFFLELFEKNLLTKADPNRGKFRTFMLTALGNYARHQYRADQALKRGGDVLFKPLSGVQAEQRYATSAPGTLSPEAAFDRAWAMTLLNRVLELLENEYADRPGFFAALRPYLTADSRLLSYAETATKLGVPPLQVKVIVHRLRHRYRRLLDEQLMATLEHAGDLEAERTALLAAVSGQ